MTRRRTGGKARAWCTVLEARWTIERYVLVAIYAQITLEVPCRVYETTRLLTVVMGVLMGLFFASSLSASLCRSMSASNLGLKFQQYAGFST